MYQRERDITFKQWFIIFVIVGLLEWIFNYYVWLHIQYNVLLLVMWNILALLLLIRGLVIVN